MNLSAIKTPGVYIDEVSLLPPSVAGVETGIPAFLGYVQHEKDADGKLLKNFPIRISSMMDYEAIFGGPQPEDDGLSIKITEYMGKAPTATSLEPVLRTEVVAAFDETKRSKHILYYSLQLYFANGGGPCYIISTGVYSGDGQLQTPADFTAALEVLKTEDEPTMIVVPEAAFMPNADQLGLYQAALNQAAKLQDRFVIMDVKQKATNLQQVKKDIDDFRNDAASPTNDRKYGAAYYPYLVTTIDYNYTGKEAAVSISHNRIKYDAPTVLVPASPADKGFDGKKLGELKDTDNLLYRQLKNELSNVPMVMPPSPAIAGIYAKTDSERGVWKSPANVGVAGIVGLNVKIDDDAQAGMNVDSTAGKSINAIRTLTGRGTVVWGARTLEGNDNEWRYVSVRRFFNYVEESVKKASFRFVFEPNDANTWVKVRGMIENFLTLQWRQGALMGTKPEQAFYVKVGLDQTMTADDILNGFLIIEIGMAVVRPAEFIILRFTHKLPEA